jgi:hypothetical protein
LPQPTQACQVPAAASDVSKTQECTEGAGRVDTPNWEGDPAKTAYNIC